MNKMLASKVLVGMAILNLIHSIIVGATLVNIIVGILISVVSLYVAFKHESNPKQESNNGTIK